MEIIHLRSEDTLWLGRITNLFFRIRETLQDILESGVAVFCVLAIRRIVPEPIAQELWAKVEGIAKRLVTTLEDITTGHEHLHASISSVIILVLLWRNGVVCTLSKAVEQALG